MKMLPKPLVLAAALLCGSAAHAADWFPLQVNSTGADGKSAPANYVALAKAAQPWDICVSFPHLKDSFWLAANYGITEEAKRLGVRAAVLDAGGFTQLANQISQIENCVAGGAKAVIIGAISQDGLNNLVAELKRKNIPVVDAYNGIASKEVDARSLTAPRDEGWRAGRYLAEKHPKGGKAVKVAWLPGPAGAGWVELFNSGFREAIKDSAVEIAETKYGDTGKEVQARLIEDILQAHKDIDYVAGTAVTAEAAVTVLRARGLTGKVKVVSVYMTPGVYQGLRNKSIEASNMAPVVLVGRIAVDQAVRLLEKKELLRDVGPIGRVYTDADIGTLKTDTVLAPTGFRPVFKVGS
ncbi:MAG: TMAO reductase system protein TorT [Rubrivivax sp. SCN 71-131]|jgi:protein TorT|nr:MAG: TMAO reductase system protein TorT [Rubrivivax sp. SCN 71-131]